MMVKHQQNQPDMLENSAKLCHKRSGAEGAQTPTTPEPKPRNSRRRPLTNHIPESRPFEQGQTPNKTSSSGEQKWKHIGDLARNLAEKAGGS